MASGYKKEELQYSVPLHEGKRIDNRLTSHSNWINSMLTIVRKDREENKHMPEN